MRTYYVFGIKTEIHNLYTDKEEALYNILKRIKVVKKPNLEYGLSIYNQICNTFNFEKSLFSFFITASSIASSDGDPQPP